MTSFHFAIGSRARHAGRFIGRVRGELLRALAQRKSEGSLPQQLLADKLGIERSLINRQLSGEANLSLRSLADLAWAMDMEISFELKRPAAEAGQNHPLATSTVSHGQIKYINGSARRGPGHAVPAGAAPEHAKNSA
ncbi:XRE family transcriptional regulator [Bradyrhizobium sp.]|uniref:helix-turn-helix domain-containing protein n=1 Tax=Bradyrhizobium sp. TaxID=376 RepID=UPI002399DB56|nr:XRE family transcriptional regulator [Bradyrhizobium sp.]MDE1935922.1 XRE family transcriptional regulator [Bradyrhizobium sp.]